MSHEVRFAVKEDFDRIMVMAEMFNDEHNLFPFSANAAALTAQLGIDRNNVFIGVLGDIGSIYGMICIAIENGSFHHDCPYLRELFIFVDTAERRANSGKKLIEFSKKMSIELNLPLFMCFSSDERVEKKTKFFERLLPKFGVLFLYNKECLKQTGGEV